MKVMFAGDTHGQIGTVKKILREADELFCDVVFQLGDFGYWEHTGDGVEYLNQVNHYAKLYDTPVYFIDGNHDKTSLLLEKYDERDAEGFIRVRDYVKYSPRGHRWTWDGLRFASFGGAYSVDKDWRLHLEYKNHLKIEKHNAYRGATQKSSDTSGTLWFPEEEMTDEDMEKFLTDTTPVDIMLAHDKPRASRPDWNRKDLSECWPNQDRHQKAVVALKPKVYLHGHLHHRYVDQILCGDNYQYTTVMGLNADGEKGTTHVIDLAKYKAALDEDSANQDAWW